MSSTDISGSEREVGDTAREAASGDAVPPKLALIRELFSPAAKQGRPSIMTVEVLSLGSEPLPQEPAPAQKTSGYNPDSPVQVLGAGPLSEQARARLTASLTQS